MRKLCLLSLMGLVVLAFTIGHAVRGALDIELSAASIQSLVAGLTWKGPLLYLALVTFRQFLLLPSSILLPIGGLCFGALMGTALGSAGIVLSGLIKFSLARGVRRNWNGSPSRHRLPAFARRVESAGPFLIGVSTAHPMGPMAALHWAAGFSAIPLGSFLVALALGGLIRAGTYATLGASFGGPDRFRFYAACVLTLAVSALPLAHPAVRRLLAGRTREATRAGV